jgi:hypothetical protein
MKRVADCRKRERQHAIILAVGIVVGISAACDSPAPTELARPQASGSYQATVADAPSAASYDAEVPIAWMRLSFDLTREESLFPPNAARAFAYIGVALWEGVAPGVPGGRSLGGQLNGLAGLPAMSQQLHWPTVANAVLANIMQRFYTSASSAVAIRQLEHAFESRFRSEIPGSIYGPSIAHAQRVATAVWQWSRGDGYRQLSDCPYTPQPGPGQWVPTPPDFQAPVQPCWGHLRPLVLSDVDVCAPVSHPAYSEHPGSPFHEEAMEVYETVNGLTDEQRTIAFFWADLAGETATPPGHSLSITAQVLEQLDASLDVTAEAFARVGLGESDAFIASWATKYHYNLLRPVTYIHELIDPGWLPVLDTPPFPAYTSGHSNDAGASSTILTAMFGDGFAFTDHTHDRLGFAPRSYPSFYDAANESAFSRLYGGIHYRADIEQGLVQGFCVGRAVNALAFRVGGLANR